MAKIGVEAVPNRWSGNSKRTVAESGVGALKYASSRLRRTKMAAAGISYQLAIVYFGSRNWQSEKFEHYTNLSFVTLYSTEKLDNTDFLWPMDLYFT